MNEEIALTVVAAATAAIVVAVHAAVAATNRRPRKYVGTIAASFDFECVVRDPAYNVWFKANLRCSQQSSQLCGMMRPHFDGIQFTRYSYERGVDCALYFLGSPGGFRECAAAMHVSKSWCLQHVNRVIDVLFSNRSIYIHLPQCAAELESIEEGFRLRKGLPHYVGAIEEVWRLFTARRTLKDGTTGKV